MGPVILNASTLMAPLRQIVCRARQLLLPFGILFLLAGCSADELDIGPRPASELVTVVEAYLQRYQPGPLPRVFQSTFMYDRNGVLLAELYSEGRRSWISLDRISPHLVDATVATEDASFFVNAGIDPVRIAGAALQNLEEGEIVSGASTITMQLARNLFMGFDDRYDQTFDRKIVEAGLARELTESYTKAEILEMYLNLLNYGQLAYGPEAAARSYFGKSAADLSLAEATLLAGIPKGPALLNPFLNFQGARQRQRVVLDLMVRHGYLTTEEADDVYREAIVLNPDPTVGSIRAPHFVNYVVNQLDTRLGGGFVRRAGLHIYTSLDLQLQETAQSIVAENVAELQPRYGMNNAALVAMKPGSAEILAMVGSIDHANDDVDGQVNVSTSLRQPGSAIKPILFATGLDLNLISPATVLWDTPMTYTVGLDQEYEPENYDDEFHGPVTVRTALANSYNVPAVKLLDALGVETMLNRARAMGIASLSRSSEWYGLSLTLGGGEVSLLDLATSYNTMANQGRYVPPLSVLAISDSQGLSLLDTSNRSEPVQVLSQAAAFLITDIMSDNNARVPMFGSNSYLRLSRPAAAKTGTTDDNRDAWTVGYTRYLLAGVWTGNTQGAPMRSATGVSAAGPIWHEFMERVFADPELLARIGAPTDLAAWSFPAPPDVEERNVCPPGLTCRPGGNEYFSRAWLEQAAVSGGPLADSVIDAPSNSVYSDSRFLGYCLAETGRVRTLVRLPARFGLPIAVQSAMLATEPGNKQATLTSDVSVRSAGIDPISLDVPLDLAINERDLDDEMLRDRQEALTYAGRVRGQVSLGPCDEISRLVPNAYVSQDSGGPGQADASEQDGAGENEVVLQFAESTRFRLISLYHDNNCPGSYVMGTLLDDAGSPSPGVNVRLTDGWGNQFNTVSKGGADSGRFDFPLYSGSPQDLRIQILDASGTPISASFVIPHRRSAESDFSCHHVVLQDN